VQKNHFFLDTACERNYFLGGRENADVKGMKVNNTCLIGNNLTNLVLNNWMKWTVSIIFLHIVCEKYLIFGVK